MLASLAVAAAALAVVAAPAVAQDPANGWVTWGTGVNPDGSNSRLTKIEAKWKVLSNPQVGGAFFSPWLGQDTTDNLNLLQPVNPWLGNSWAIYCEYFQWQPEHNQNSAQWSTEPGNTLHGVVEYNEGQQSYTLTQTDMKTGHQAKMTIPVQTNSDGSYKNYTIVYLVFEKVWSCPQYPPDNEVTFFDINVEYDNKKVTPKWTTGNHQNTNCGFKTDIVDGSTIKMTWSSSAEDSWPLEEYKNLALLDRADLEAVYKAHGREAPALKN